MYEKESLFRCHLDEQEKNFLRPYKPLHLEQTELPFLKIQGKIHKLSQEDIETKNYSSLTFRPVCDSKFFTTKPLASALLTLLRELNVLVTKTLPSNILPSSGWEIAEFLSNIESFDETVFSIFIPVTWEMPTVTATFKILRML